MSQNRLLSPEEECKLVLACRDGSADARHHLVESFMPLVRKIAAYYCRASGAESYHELFRELVQTGVAGLLKAIDKFDPQRENRLSTYAGYWIRSEIQDYVLRFALLVRMGTTAKQKTLFFNLRRLKGKLGELGDNLSDKSAAAIANELGVRKGEVIEMNGRMARRDLSLNISLERHRNGNEWQDLLPDVRPSPEDVIAYREEFAHRRGLLREALTSLPERERIILVCRRLDEPPKTLEVLGVLLGISKERVRQLEARALRRIRELAQERFPDLLLH